MLLSYRSPLPSPAPFPLFHLEKYENPTRNYRLSSFKKVELSDIFSLRQVVIIMLNEQWALSGECQDEYNYAKRLNLTSYESGRSERGQPRLPAFCPIAFKVSC